MSTFEEDLKNRVWATGPVHPQEFTETEDPEEAEAEEFEGPEDIGESSVTYETYEEPVPEPKEAKKLKKSGKRRRRRRKVNPLLLLLLIVLFIAGTIMILNSQIFAIRKIQVEGNRYYTPSQVISMSGIESGRNLIFELKTRAARNELLKSPYIKTAIIERVPPDTVKIEITERLEYAAVSSEGQFIIIDKDGTVLRITDAPPEITVMEGIEVSESEEGKPLKAKQTYILTETLRLLASTDAADLFFKKVYFSAAIVRTYFDDNYYCEGTPENILKNLSAIKELAEQHYSQNINKGVIKVGTDGYLSFSPRID